MLNAQLNTLSANKNVIIYWIPNVWAVREMRENSRWSSKMGGIFAMPLLSSLHKFFQTHFFQQHCTFYSWVALKWLFRLLTLLVSFTPPPVCTVFLIKKTSLNGENNSNMLWIKKHVGFDSITLRNFWWMSWWLDLFNIFYSGFYSHSISIQLLTTPLLISTFFLILAAFICRCCTIQHFDHVHLNYNKIRMLEIPKYFESMQKGKYHWRTTCISRKFDLFGHLMHRCSFSLCFVCWVFFLF